MPISDFKISVFVVLVFTGAALVPAACTHHPTNHPSEQAGNQAVQKAAEDIYTCPMHPQIIRHQPGNCPICGMTLVKKALLPQKRKIQP
ncbi:heavy metal-binding domain-containing protein [Puia sp. P3]|uniref:heavy metal-binding domain-containing protein n=1 Tax=Puia sp. P3 TaxID=3423952 RepID=UPI003D665A0E